MEQITGTQRAIDQLPSIPMGTEQFSAEFRMKADPGHRKRQVGDPVNWVPSKRARTGAEAVAAGYQLRHAAVPPLINEEIEPGEAVQYLLGLDHPLAKEADLTQLANLLCEGVCQRPETVVQLRKQAIERWRQRAEDLKMESLEEIDRIPDAALKLLLLHDDPDVSKDRKVGTFTHLALWRGLAQEAGDLDLSYIEEFKTGFGIVGPIAKSGAWPDLLRPVDLTEKDLDERAWEIRQKVIQKVQGRKVDHLLEELWKKTIEDRDMGFCLGPYYDEDQVSRIVGSDKWICTERLPVEQKGKVREVDSATENFLNTATEVREKLILSSTDGNVALIRKLRRKLKEIGRGSVRIKGWVLDEKKAYRQIPVHPDHRKWAVVALKDPETGRVAFFVMIGHSFGLTSAVYNYNRRSRLIDSILSKIFLVLCGFFYDDKFGFEPEDTVGSAAEAAKFLHHVLGIRTDEKKLQLTSKPVILGVQYDLEALVIRLTEERKEDLLTEIEAILEADQGRGKLLPAQASKLRGKLGFGATHFWGKVGRAFFRALSERQYSVHKRSSVEPGGALRACLVQWARIISNGKPRSLEAIEDPETDAVIFTDGFSPEEGSEEPSRIGGVLFDKRLPKPVFFTMPVDQETIDQWIPRSNPISMVEMFAAVIALTTFARSVQGKKVLLMIDSESALGGLVKGYSAKEDLCRLVGIFWDLGLKLDSMIYLDRISTDANPADDPSRDQIDKLLKRGWIMTPPVLWEEFLEGLGSSC